MADTKISALPAAGSVADANEFAINEAGTSKKVTAAQIATHANAAHLADGADAHDASAVSSVAAGNMSSTDVQAAINELDGEKAGLALHNLFTDASNVFGAGGADGSVWIGSFGTPNGYLEAKNDAGFADLIIRGLGTGSVISEDRVTAPSFQRPYAPGSFTIPTAHFDIRSKQLALTTSQRVTIEGTARLHMAG